MKRVSVISYTTFAFTFFFGAQAMAQMEFGFGPILGVNFGTLTFSPSDYSPADQYPRPGATQIGRTGFIFGIQSELGFANKFYIDLQPCYVEKGYGVTGPVGTISFLVDEIELPVFFKVKFLDGDIRPYLFAGPNVGFVLTATEKYSFPPQDVANRDFTDKAHLDFAIDIGGGAGFNVTPSMVVTADIRYSFGIANVMNSAQFMESPPVTTKASGVQILVGAMFHVQ